MGKKKLSGSSGPSSTSLDGEGLLALGVLLLVPAIIAGAVWLVCWLAWRLGIIVKQDLLGRCIHENHTQRPEHGVRICDRCGAWHTYTYGVAETELERWQPKETSPRWCWHLRTPITRKIEEFNIYICQECGCWRRWAQWQPSETCPGPKGEP